jgi:hypothetical protein
MHKYINEERWISQTGLGGQRVDRLTLEKGTLVFFPNIAQKVTESRTAMENNRAELQLYR